MIDDILGQIVRGVRAAIRDGHYDARDITPPEGTVPSLKEAVTMAAPEALLAELKPSSPSVGVLASSDGEDAHAILHTYARYGVTGLSVLTERERFGGSLGLLAAAGRTAPRLPVLMKDFVIADAQLDAARAAGASAVLFIHHLFARGQTTWELPDAIDAAHQRGLEVLLEVDHPQSLDHALTTEADLIGINNRDLRTLEMDLERTGDLLRFRLDRLGERPVLSLSGIRDREDVVTMRRAGASGVLVGTTLMAAEDRRATLRRLRGLAHVKVCGAGHPDDGPGVLAALAEADAVGCVVAAGGARRERTLEQAARLFAALPQDQEHVLVTTDTAPDACVERVEATGADAVQAHRPMKEDEAQALRAALPRHVRLIALVRVPADATPAEPGMADDGLFHALVGNARALARHADRILLDVPPLPGEDGGGTGRAIDRALARRIIETLRPIPVVLAGGLAPGNIAPTLRATRPWGIDLSSGAEGSTHGRKDAARVHSAIAEARSITGLFDREETGPAYGPPLIRDVQWRDPTFPSAP